MTNASLLNKSIAAVVCAVACIGVLRPVAFALPQYDPHDPVDLNFGVLAALERVERACICHACDGETDRRRTVRLLCDLDQRRDAAGRYRNLGDWAKKGISGGERGLQFACARLYRLAGEPETAFTPVFSDVSTENWFASAVSWAYGQQVSEGYPDGSFRPDAFVTRQELVSMLYRYLSGEVPEDGWDLSAFADQGDVPEWALPAFGWAVDKGLVNGIPDNDGRTWLHPRDPLLRSQAAALFQRLLGMTEEAAPAAEAAADTILPDAE